MKKVTITPWAVLASAVVAAIPVAAASSASVTRARAGIPEGIYRVNLSAAFLRSAGLSAGQASHDSGIQTLIFRGTRWANKTMNKWHVPDCSGDFFYSGNRVKAWTKIA